MSIEKNGFDNIISVGKRKWIPSLKFILVEQMKTFQFSTDLIIHEEHTITTASSYIDGPMKFPIE